MNMYIVLKDAEGMVNSFTAHDKDAAKAFMIRTYGDHWRNYFSLYEMVR